MHDIKYIFFYSCDSSRVSIDINNAVVHQDISKEVN